MKKLCGFKYNQDYFSLHHEAKGRHYWYNKWNKDNTNELFGTNKNRMIYLFSRSVKKYIKALWILLGILAIKVRR